MSKLKVVISQSHSRNAKNKGEESDQTKGASELPRVEWAFYEVPEDEKQACLYYEYARECKAVSRDFAIWRKRYPKGSLWPPESEVFDLWYRSVDDGDTLRRFHNSPARIVEAIAGFPEIAWLQIPLLQRRQAMARVCWDEIEQRLKFSKKEKRPALANWSNSSFKIEDWSWTDEELIGQFRNWLSKNRKKEPVHAESGRQGSPADLLAHLGALRLRRHAKLSRGSALKVLEVDTDARNLSRGAKKAAAFIAQFYK